MLEITKSVSWIKNASYELLPAMYVCCDFSAMNASKNRYEVTDAVLVEIEKIIPNHDTVKFDNRTRLYGEIIRGSKELRCDFNFCDNSLWVGNPVSRITALLGDILMNPDCADDYDSLSIGAQSITISLDFNTKVVIPLYREMGNLFNDIRSSYNFEETDEEQNYVQMNLFDDLDVEKDEEHEEDETSEHTNEVTNKTNTVDEKIILACSRCGARIEDNAQECSKCGAKLDKDDICIYKEDIKKERPVEKKSIVQTIFEVLIFLFLAFISSAIITLLKQYSTLGGIPMGLIAVLLYAPAVFYFSRVVIKSDKKPKNNKK